MGMHSKNIRIFGKTILFKFKILIKVILKIQNIFKILICYKINKSISIKDIEGY
jgi:hypothetical protein